MDDLTNPAKNKLIFALDVPDLASARPLLATLAGEIGLVKIGLELFTAEGPAVVAEARRQGLDVFLDLKLHDIPATVERAAANAVRLGAAMLTVHTGGGRAMLEAAAAAAAGTTVLGVTLLTSLDPGDLEPVGLVPDLQEVVRRRALLGRQCGLPGLVCSAQEVRSIRALVGPAMTLVVPGIRPAGSAQGDQKRIATPADAIANGADYLVVGRPIRDARDPKEAARAVVSEIAAALRLCGRS